jgi:hypothetical protein
VPETFGTPPSGVTDIFLWRDATPLVTVTYGNNA